MTLAPGPLPPPRTKSGVPLEQAISRRHSVRSFQDVQIDAIALGQILWAAQGTRTASGYRNTPSAGATYPLELYIVSRDGFFHYDPLGHVLDKVHDGDLREAIMHAALDQDFILHSPVTIVISAVPQRTAHKYGKDRSPRYIDFEVGHVAQNIMLQAVALNLGSVPVGAFNDNELSVKLGLTEDTIPLYLVPIGYPA
jgi:SagB-type dehydrogenase family enzyme